MLKAFRPVGNTCTEYYMKDIPRLSVMVLLHVEYCESLFFGGEEERTLFSFKIIGS